MRRPKKTVTINLADYLSAGTYNVKVKSKGTDIRDSEDSNVVSCLIPVIATCTVSGLGSSSPSSVTFTKSVDFTVAKLGIQEITYNGNIFIKIPTMYRKVESISSNQITSFTIANTKLDNNYEPYSCFLDENGNLLDYILIGKYHISSTTVANSVNATAVETYLSSFRTLCQAKTDVNYQGLAYDWQIHKLWQDLIICFKETVNTNSGTAWTTDELGFDWGIIGTWIDGIGYSNKSLLVSYKPTAYVDVPTRSTPDYVVISYNSATSTNGANITKLGYDSNNPFVNMPSAASGTSNTTYYCDLLYTIGVDGKYNCKASIGWASTSSGAFNIMFNGGTTGCRLCLKPIQ